MNELICLPLWVLWGAYLVVPFVLLPTLIRGIRSLWRWWRQRRRRRFKVAYDGLTGGAFKIGTIITNASGTVRGRIVSGTPSKNDTPTSGTLIIEEKP